MIILSVFLSILLYAQAVSASDAVCGNVARPQCADTVGATNYLRSIEPSALPGGCFLIPAEPPEVTSNQRTLVQSVINSHENGRCHLKVVNNLATEMTVAEKDAVNAAMQIIKDEQAAIAAEANDPQCSKATIAQIDNFFQRQWDDPANTNDFLGDITALTGNTAANIRAMTTNVVQRMLGVVKKVAKCNRAMGG